MVKYVSGAEYPRIDDFEARYNSDENQVLDSLTRIEQKAKEYGVDIDSVYNKIGFDPISFLLNNKNDAWLRETENYVSVVIERTGRKKNFIKDENAVLGFFETAETGHETGGKGFLGRVINWIEKHPYLSAGALLATYAGAIGVNQYLNNKDSANNAVDNGIAKAKSEILLSTPTASPTPAYNNTLKVNETGKTRNISYAEADNTTKKLSNKPPVAKMKIEAPYGWVEGKPLLFSANESYDPDGKIVEYIWNITDGKLYKETVITEKPFFEKELPATRNSPKIHNYRITLRVKDENNSIGTDKAEIQLKSVFSESDEKFSRTFADAVKYDGIIIKGPERFQESVVMTLDFTKKYNPDDYKFIHENTKIIVAKPRTFKIKSHITDISDYAKNSITPINSKYAILRERHLFNTFLDKLAHEAGHSYIEHNPELKKKLINEAKDMCRSHGTDLSKSYWIDLCTKKLGESSYKDWYPPELYAEKFSKTARENLSHITDEEINKFLFEFDFSKFKN